MTGTVFAGIGYWLGAPPGAVTHGLLRLSGDAPWQELTDGLPPAAEIRAIVLRPDDPRIIFAGTQHGPYRSDDGGDSWRPLGLPGELQTVWSIALHPTDPDTLFVGVAGFAIFRTRDGGESWRKLDVPTPAGLPPMPFPTRVIRIAIDPADPDVVYAGLEVNGVVRSRDGGDTWTDISGGLLALARQDHLKDGEITGTPNEGMMDIHALTVSRAHPGTLVLANRMGLFRSDDRGGSWHEMGVGRFSPLTYARDVQASPHDPECLYSALSVAAIGDAGSLYRSRDFGASWQRFDAELPIVSTLMAIAQSPLDPARVYCGARLGQVFGTEDGGASWRAAPLPANVQGIYALACI
jgi:photosystem II stability/assembly factor-like uncharacterized protein